MSKKDPIEKAELREYRASLSRTLRARGVQVAEVAEVDMAKYSPDQPRDDRGRWASGGGSAAELEAAGGANVGPGGSFVSNPVLDVMSRQYGTSTYGRPLHEVARIVAQSNVHSGPAWSSANAGVPAAGPKWVDTMKTPEGVQLAFDSGTGRVHVSVSGAGIGTLERQAGEWLARSESDKVGSYSTPKAGVRALLSYNGIDDLKWPSSERTSWMRE